METYLHRKRFDTAAEATQWLRDTLGALSDERGVRSVILTSGLDYETKKIRWMASVRPFSEQ